MILLIYNKALDKMTMNSILKIFRDLNLYRNDVIIYKIFLNEPIEINKYKEDIIEIIEKNKIDLIFCVWSFLAYTKKYENKNLSKCIKEEENIIQNLNKWNLKVKILCHIHDFFYKLKQYQKLENINRYIEIGFRDQIQLYTNPNNKVYEIMHCATNKFIKKINLNPINKILLSGKTSNIFYPERANFLNYYKKNITKVDTLNHPCHFSNLDNNYPEILNNYIACFYSSIKVNELENNKIILAKAFEIPASGSLLLAHDSCKDSLSRIGFIENINCMFINENNYDKVIDYILNEKNRTKINEMRKNGQELVLKNHTENHRIAEINKLLDDIILEDVNNKSLIQKIN